MGELQKGWPAGQKALAGAPGMNELRGRLRASKRWVRLGPSTEEGAVLGQKTTKRKGAPAAKGGQASVGQARRAGTMVDGLLVRAIAATGTDEAGLASLGGCVSEAVSERASPARQALESAEGEPEPQRMASTVRQAELTFREVRKVCNTRQRGIGRGVAVVLSGVRRIEARLGKRLVMKRESCKLEHRKAAREVVRRLEYHGSRSPTGRIAKGKRIEMVGQRKGGYYGYSVRVQGTRNAARRTTYRHKRIGKTLPGMKHARIGEWVGVAKTSVGTRGVQVKYCYGAG